MEAPGNGLLSTVSPGTRLHPFGQLLVSWICFTEASAVVACVIFSSLLVTIKLDCLFHLSSLSRLAAARAYTFLRFETIFSSFLLNEVEPTKKTQEKRDS